MQPVCIDLIRKSKAARIAGIAARRLPMTLSARLARSGTLQSAVPREHPGRCEYFDKRGAEEWF
jgi:hypothetical protein